MYILMFLGLLNGFRYPILISALGLGFAEIWMWMKRARARVFDYGDELMGDTESDGTPYPFDTDDDSDGVPTPTDAVISSYADAPDYIDTDNDDSVNNFEPDDDSDGLKTDDDSEEIPTIERTDSTPGISHTYPEEYVHPMDMAPAQIDTRWKSFVAKIREKIWQRIRR